jgi:hypothetical protein
MMLFRCYCAQSAITARSRVLKQMRYDPAYAPAEDYEFNARLSQRSKMWNLPDVLCHYRRHAASSSTVQRPAAEAALIRLYRSQLDPLGIHPSESELFVQRSLFEIETRGRAPLDQVHAWLEKLLLANEQTKIYDHHAFAGVIAAQWLYACWSLAERPITRLRRFIAAPLLKKTRLSVPDWVRFGFNAAERRLRIGVIPRAQRREHLCRAKPA